jgi:hypothetical protein
VPSGCRRDDCAQFGLSSQHRFRPADEAGNLNEAGPAADFSILGHAISRPGTCQLVETADQLIFCERAHIASPVA